MHKAISVLKAAVEDLCLCFAPQVDEVPLVPSREGGTGGGDGLGVNLICGRVSSTEIFKPRI